MLDRGGYTTNISKVYITGCVHGNPFSTTSLFGVLINFDCSDFSLGNPLAIGKEKTKSILSLWFSTDRATGY